MTTTRPTELRRHRKCYYGFDTLSQIQRDIISDRILGAMTSHNPIENLTIYNRLGWTITIRGQKFVDILQRVDADWKTWSLDFLGSAGSNVDCRIITEEEERTPVIINNGIIIKSLRDVIIT